jgi:hypothetical protein
MKKSVLFFLIYIFQIISSIKLKGDDEDDKQMRKLPLINVMMDQPLRDPNDVKEIELMRRIEKDRRREIDQMQQIDRRNFDVMLGVQRTQQSKLDDILGKYNTMLEELKKAGNNEEKTGDNNCAIDSNGDRHDLPQVAPVTGVNNDNNSEDQMHRFKESEHKLVNGPVKIASDLNNFL